MEETNKKECPKCGSSDVFEISKFSDVVNLKETQGEIEPKYPVYKCRECEEIFIVKELKQK